MVEGEVVSSVVACEVAGNVGCTVDSPVGAGIPMPLSVEVVEAYVAEGSVVLSVVSDVVRCEVGGSCWAMIEACDSVCCFSSVDESVWPDVAATDLLWVGVVV